MLVSRNIHIVAPVERVFALMCDPAARARLNPQVTPLRVEIQNDTSLHDGSVCHFRVQLGRQIIDYRTRVREFVPHRRIVSVSDTAVPFEVIIETLPENGGTRLTQSERFEPTEGMRSRPATVKAPARGWPGCCSEPCHGSTATMRSANGSGRNSGCRKNWRDSPGATRS